jgi:uncharacterized C2H2 Zn-finger protein
MQWAAAKHVLGLFASGAASWFSLRVHCARGLIGPPGNSSVRLGAKDADIVFPTPIGKRASANMARARRATSSNTDKRTTASSGDSSLPCPECGKTFTRPASLGAHRNRAHGVVGASARRTSTRRSARVGGSARRHSGASTTGGERIRTRSNSRSSASGRGAVNRDALLQTLFPQGVPPREEVIRRTNAWLDEAERLARAE